MESKASSKQIVNSNVRLKKSLGQNFLTEKNIVEKIIKTANIDKDTNVIEIGPGIGALTEYLIAASKFTTAIEIDDQLIPVLEQAFSESDNFALKHADFLQLDTNQLSTHGAMRTKVVANLPYYITTPIITKILNEIDFVDEIYIMVQKEVAERICASAKTKQYGSLSVYCQLLCEVKYEFTVKRTVFMPPPNVDSAIISLKRNNKSINIKQVEKFVKNCFKQKRKTLVNNLSKSYMLEKDVIINFLDTFDLPKTARAEEITPELFVLMSSKFESDVANG